MRRGGFDLVFETDVAGERECVPARLLDGLDGTEDRAGEFRMRFDRLRDDRDVRSVTRGTQCDRQSDPSTRPGNK